MSKRKHNTWVVWRRYRFVKGTNNGKTVWGKWGEWEKTIAITTYPDVWYSARDEARVWVWENLRYAENGEFKVLPEGREPK